MVVVWNTQNVSRDGDVSVLAKVHTDVDISTIKVACFDDTRFLRFPLLVHIPGPFFNVFSVCGL